MNGRKTDGEPSRGGLLKVRRRSKRYWRYLGVTALTVAGAMALLLGAPGSALATHVTCGQTITQDTKLDSDLLGCTGDGIVIGADNITLDLNGHVVGGDDDISDHGVQNFGGFDGVTVTNGQIQDFGVGARFFSSVASRFTGLTVTSNTGSAIVLELSSPSGSIVRNSITNNNFGVVLTFSSMNEVTGNSIDNNAASGLLILTDSDQNQVTRNSFFSNDEGIHVEDNSGSTTADGNVLRGNSASNHVTVGLNIGAGAVGTNLIRNDATANTFDGIHVASGAINTLLLGNNSSSNFEDGIQVDSSATTLTKNVANFNTAFGILAVAGVTDGGGNRAKGNGAGQCVNVSC
jgi:parallel beta-helix repeat protein